MPDTGKPWAPAVWNGLRCRCPRCGNGELYRRYMSVRETCPECGLDFSRRPGEILPAYLVITLAGLAIIAVSYGLLMIVGLHPLMVLAIAVPLGFVIPVLLLPPVKGAVIALQWAKGVQGFDEPES